MTCLIFSTVTKKSSFFRTNMSDRLVFFPGFSLVLPLFCLTFCFCSEYLQSVLTRFCKVLLRVLQSVFLFYVFLFVCCTYSGRSCTNFSFYLQLILHSAPSLLHKFHKMIDQLVFFPVFSSVSPLFCLIFCLVA